MKYHIYVKIHLWIIIIRHNLIWLSPHLVHNIEFMMYVEFNNAMAWRPTTAKLLSVSSDINLQFIFYSIFLRMLNEQYVSRTES